MLVLDAADEAPGYLLTLTTHDPDTTPEMFTRAGSHVWQALRRRYGRVEFYGRLEDTTGRGRLSGGRRRLHSHNLIKADGLNVAEAEEVARRAWAKSLQSQGASGWAWRVQLEPIRTPAALIHYVNQHYAKADQHVRPELRVRTERYSRGYFRGGVPALREEARAQLHAERMAWAFQRDGFPIDVDEARMLVDGERAKWADLRAARAAVREIGRPVPWVPPEPALALFGDEDIPF